MWTEDARPPGPWTRTRVVPTSEAPSSHRGPSVVGVGVQAQIEDHNVQDPSLRSRSVVTP